LIDSTPKYKTKGKKEKKEKEKKKKYIVSLILFLEFKQ
jgi:hypothetical protein